MTVDLIIAGEPRPRSEVDRLLAASGLGEAPGGTGEEWVDRVAVPVANVYRPDVLAVHAVAARLGWRMDGPERGWPRRDAGALPPDLAFDLPAGPSRRTKRWVAATAVRGTARTISVADDGTCAVAYEAPGGAPDTDCEIQVLSGPDLATVVARYRELRPPAALSPDGRFLAAAEVTRSPFARNSLPPGVRVIAVGEADRPAGVHWPLRSVFGWLPCRSDEGGAALAALTRHAHQRPPVAAGAVPPSAPTAAVTDLLALEEDAEARAVVVDVSKGAVTALERHRHLRGTAYEHCAALAVAGGTIVTASSHRVLGFRADTGKLIWTQPPGGHYPGQWNTAAGSPCGRLVALAGRGGYTSVNLFVLDAATGAIRLALTNRVLGSPAAPTAVCFHPSGWLAVGFGDGRVAHLSLTGSATVYRGLPRAVSALAFTADGSTLLVGGNEPRGLCAVELAPHERHPV